MRHDNGLHRLRALGDRGVSTTPYAVDLAPAAASTAIRLIINHEAAVTDRRGVVWIPYVIVAADGSFSRLGMMPRDALGAGPVGGATCQDLPVTGGHRKRLNQCKKSG